ncbi:MAG TPA: hypothetical protein VFN76_00575, partial [Candidatus Limnocylindria bacterium]|nr:hypothetical protein [Candidatus Limnocylindria bacterium]
VDFAAVDLALVVFVGVFALDDFVAVDLLVAGFAVDFAAGDFTAVDFADERDRADERFESSPTGSALPTALTAPLATSPTVPATVPATLPAVFPAVRPTCFTILAGSGIGCPPFVRLVGRRSSVRSARFMPPCCACPFAWQSKPIRCAR